MTYFIIVFLVLMSGMFSGLTLGMFSLSLSTLERKIKLGDKKAEKVYKIRKKGNLLLCTLLLGNVAVNSAIALYLESISSGIIAGLISTGLIVIFGEILPQSIFARFALKLGSKTTWFLRILLFVLFPIAGPLAFILDKILGKELSTIWNKNELREIIKIHEDSPRSLIDHDEEKIILGALSYSNKKSLDIMTPQTVAFCLDACSIINKALLEKVKEKGFTRIPVFKNNANSIISILFTKELIGLNGTENIKIEDLCTNKELITIKGSMKLDNLFNLFITKKNHMAFVYDKFGVLLGLITLEDVVEEILKTEIVDEADKVEDMQALAKEKFKKKLIE